MRSQKVDLRVVGGRRAFWEVVHLEHLVLIMLEVIGANLANPSASKRESCYGVCPRSLVNRSSVAHPRPSEHPQALWHSLEIRSNTSPTYLNESF